MPPKKILTALQSAKDVQRDQKSDPICSSFPTTVLSVSGSRVKARLFAKSQPESSGTPKMELFCG
jgi:hypothetical protein